MNSSLNLITIVSGLIVLFSGIIVLLLAKKLPMNPFIGFRIGYTYVSRRLWIKANRLSGLVLTLIGLVAIITSLYINPIYALTIMMISMIVMVVVLVEYFSREAEKELLRIPETKTEKHVVIRSTLLAIPVLIILALSILLITTSLITYYPRLPDKVAVHFSLDGTPNRYGSREELLVSVLLGPGIFYALTLYMVYLAARKPESFYKPWFKPSDVSRFMNSILLLFSIATLVLTLVNYDLLYYNVVGSHIIAFPLIILASIVLILIVLIYTIYITGKAYFRRQSRPGI